MLNRNNARLHRLTLDPPELQEPPADYGRAYAATGKDGASATSPRVAGPVLLILGGVLGACAAALAILTGEGLGRAVLLYFGVSLLPVATMLVLSVAGARWRAEAADRVDLAVTRPIRAGYARSRRIRAALLISACAILLTLAMSANRTVLVGVAAICLAVILHAALGRPEPGAGKSH